ncbi:hypothetical protein GWN65_05300 [Candidatus Bathyarchaeota archaeon]|nr:hypothetical protein [Candidatus Bathyarchaeota archaeon]NIV44577.1 hypothetical protein [Candidatus Bathyarchaeota archaeon]
MAIREKYIEKLVELFKSYMKSGKSLDTFEEVRYQASQLGKKLFKEKVPLDWIVGLYIEAVRRIKSEVPKEALDLASCGELLLEMVMAYSTNFLRYVELREQRARRNCVGEMVPGSTPPPQSGMERSLKSRASSETAQKEI